MTSRCRREPGHGLGIVEACLAEGAKLALTARGAEALAVEHARLAKTWGGRPAMELRRRHARSCSIETAITRTEAEFGAIWGAVANVGLHPCPPGFELDDETWDAGLNQNLDCAFRLARSALRRMTPRGEGALLLISSIAGLSALGTPLTYGTSKAPGRVREGRARRTPWRGDHADESELLSACQRRYRLVLALNTAIRAAGLRFRVIAEVSVGFGGGFQPTADIVV